MKIIESTYKGKNVSVPVDGFKFYKYSDSIINIISNSSLHDCTASEIRDTAKKYLGNSYYLKYNFYFSNHVKYFNYQEKCILYDDFYLLINSWRDSSINKIQKIYNRKVERYEWIKNNPDSVNTIYLSNFLNNSDDCDIDKKSIIEIIIVNPDDFLTESSKVFKLYQLKWRLSDLPDGVFIR